LAKHRNLSARTFDRKQIKADQDYCVELVQKRDREGYLCGLLMPAHARKSYFAVRAYNVELASVKDASEQRRASGETGSSLGLRMRMQWWRDALGQLYDDAPATLDTPSPQGFLAHSAEACWHNPVVRALYIAIEEKDLTRRFLERLLDAREADLDIQQMASVEDSKQYAEDTWSSLMYLSLECTGVRDDDADTVASHAGIGTGLTMSLRSTIHRAAHGEMAIPADLFPRPVPSNYMMRRMDPEYPVDSENEEIMKNAAQHMAYEASQELSKARDLQGDVPKAGKACLLPAIPAMNYLSRLNEAKFDLWDTKLNTEQLRLKMLTAMGKTWLTGKI
jgi:NADH dehydrogenase [ubiquinone] 1 alpha subcomplex assembly factor 6